MSNISSQSIDQIKLSEAQEYYLELFRKWQKWQIESPEKLKLNYLMGIKDISEAILKIESNEGVDFQTYYKLAICDSELSKIYILLTWFDSKTLNPESKKSSLIYSKADTMNKQIFIIKDRNSSKLGFVISFEQGEGILDITNLNNRSVKIDIFDCNFDFIRLKGFNISDFDFMTRNELLRHNKQNTLELIDCNFLELDNLKKEQEILTLQNELELAQKTTIQPQQIFDFSSKIPKEYWEPFATYFSGFKSFIKRAKGKSLGMEININGDFMFRVYSDDPEDLVGIEQDLSDFLLAITYYSKNQFDSYQRMQNGETVSINNLVMEGKVSQLIQEVKYLELENKTLRTIVSIVPEILQNIQESIHQNYLQNQLLLEYYKPKIFTEGKTDVDYLKTAIKIFGKQYPELLKVEIDEIGIQEDGQTRDGGVPNLNAYFKANKNKTSNLSTQIVLLYDCDTNQKLENIDNKLFKVGIKYNSNNQKYKIGIENLLPQSYFETDDYYKQTTKTDPNTGKKTTIEELDKVKLCQNICSQARPEDFKNFEELLNQLNQIVIQ